MGYKEDGKWWVSQSNFAEEVIKSFNFPKKIEILDTTLRDGEQQPGIILTRSEKVEIAKKLAKAGVQRIEAGTPAASQEDADAIKEIAELNLGPKIFAFVRNTPDDMKLAKACGVNHVLAEIPGSEHLLKFGKRWSPEKAIKAAIEATQAAKELGLYVTFFPADSSRASLEFLVDAVHQISEGGHMDALALVDTFGCYSPEGAAYAVRRLKKEFSVPIEVHFHNDFGMGVSSTIAGLAAGAEVAHVTVNGIGERTGSVSLEQLVLALKVLYNVDAGIDLSMLKDLSRLVEKTTGYPVYPTQPVVGDKIFGWETGMPSSLWANCKDEQPLAMLPYHWSLTGQTEPKLYLGKKSGKDNVKAWVKENNLDLTEEQEKAILGKVKDLSLKLKRDLTSEEFINLAKEI
ncbi:MAG: hypothetical protein RBR71_08200 [Gudongella sp.]|nr:hypothetical protein [Gudongella sp.]